MEKEYIVKITNAVEKDGFERFENEYSPDELVRCRDCMYWKNQGTSTGWLPCMEIKTRGNWFCASGKKEV